MNGEHGDMNDDRFLWCLDHWGSDLAAWPEAEARAARLLLEVSPDARRHFEAAQEVANWLGGLRAHTAPPGLRTRILARLPEPTPVPAVLRWLTARMWRPVLAAALPLVVGFVVGIGLPDRMDALFVEEISTLAFNDIWQELDDANP
jgi:hypothetical protein